MILALQVASKIWIDLGFEPIEGTPQKVDDLDRTPMWNSRTLKTLRPQSPIG